MDMIDHNLDGSDEKDVDNELLGKDLVTAQPLTIVEEDPSLSPDGSGSIPQGLLDNSEEEITYQLRSTDGVTYKVVSVGGEELEGIPQIITTNGSSFTSSQAQGVQATALVNSVNGQLFVIGSPQEVFSQQNQRNIVPRSQNMNIQIESVKNSSSSSQCRPRDDRRRATHNEVERRRRDKINHWIMKLSKIIPECSQDSGKGSFETQSKGGILAKACDYIVELRTCNQRLMEFGKENEQLAAELETVSRQLEEARHENDQLRAQLADHGITPCHHLDSLNTIT